MGKKEQKLYEKEMAGSISKVDMLNMSNTAVGYKNAIGMEPEKIAGMCIDITDDVDDGETTNTSYIVFESGKIVGGVSSTACKTIHEAIPVFTEMLASGEALKASFKMGTSNSDREFIQVIFS